MQNYIRFFLSSTFRDLQEERDYIVNAIFPALRDISEHRGIPFSWCDLRFGVSSFDEENIIRICLKNVESCSPCIVGLLGENYGSIPKKLNTEQIKRLSIFQGVPAMLKKQYGYTEIEMRYFISQNEGKDALDFYFFIGDYNLKYDKNWDWKYILPHPLSSIKKFMEYNKVNSWKRYVFINSKQLVPRYWNFEKDEPIEKNIIYQGIKEAIEARFPIAQFPNEELIWNEQQSYIQSLVSSTIPLENLKKEFEYRDSKDILNLYSHLASGKTIYLANLIKKSTEKGVVCFYYFIGASRNPNTPMNIWKGILYQVCRYKTINYDLFIQINDMDELRDVITLQLQQISKDVLIVIDGFGNDVICSFEHKNTFISDFPAPQSNIKYILSSSNKLSETSRMDSIEYKLSDDILQEFVKKYSYYYYGCSNRNQILPEIFKPVDLREARYCIDERFNNDFSFSISDNDTDLQNNIYKRINTRIIRNIKHQTNYHEGDKQLFFDDIITAIHYLSLIRYGILESDICRVCNIGAEQWTIIYSYLSPFFTSKGYIRLNDCVAEQFVPNNQEDIRIQLIENLQKCNRNNQYTTEILYQASKLNNKRTLCTILSNIEIFNFLYESDKDLLAIYLLNIDESCLTIEFECMIKGSLSNQPVTELLIDLNRIINAYYEVLPRFEVVLHYINYTNTYIIENHILPKQLLEFLVLKVKIYIEIGNFDEAFKTLQLSDRILKEAPTNLEEHNQYTLKFLLLKAKLFDNDLQERSERTNALEIYKEILEKYKINLKTEDLLHVLDRSIRLENNVGNRRGYIRAFNNIFYNRKFVKENSHLFNKYCIYLTIYSIYESKLDSESKEVDDLFTQLFCKLEEAHKLYPYTHDNCDNMFFVIELLFARINKLRNKNLYNQYKNNVISAINKVTELVSLSELIYSKESISKADAMFQIARLYDNLSFILPLKKNEYLNESISYSIKAEELYNRFYQRFNIKTAKLYHNRANTYCSFADHNNLCNALSCINNAIDIKKELMHPNSDSLFNSRLRKITILVEQAIHAEDDNTFIDIIEHCKCYINELINENNNTSSLSEQIKNERLNRIKESESRLNLYIKEPRERYFDIAQRKFEECKRMITEIQDKRSAVPDELMEICKRTIELESYIVKKDLRQLFYERCNDYQKFEAFSRSILTAYS